MRLDDLWASLFRASLPPAPGLTASSCSYGRRLASRFFQLRLAATPCGSATVAVIGPDWLLSSNKILPMLGTPCSRLSGGSPNSYILSSQRCMFFSRVSSLYILPRQMAIPAISSQFLTLTVVVLKWFFSALSDSSASRRRFPADTCRKNGTTCMHNHVEPAGDRCAEIEVRRISEVRRSPPAARSGTSTHRFAHRYPQDRGRPPFRNTTGQRCFMHSQFTPCSRNCIETQEKDLEEK